MKKLIVILAITLLPTVAFGWDNDDQYYADMQRNAELRNIANEMKYQQKYQEYRDDKRPLVCRSPTHNKKHKPHFSSNAPA